MSDDSAWGAVDLPAANPNALYVLRNGAWSTGAVPILSFLRDYPGWEAGRKSLSLLTFSLRPSSRSLAVWSVFLLEYLQSI